MGVTATGSDFDETLRLCIDKKYGHKYRPLSASRVDSNDSDDGEGTYRVELISGLKAPDKDVLIDAQRISSGWEVEFLRTLE